jgi:glycosyltransferase involved in cell wall biosynthesis
MKRSRACSSAGLAASVGDPPLRVLHVTPYFAPAFAYGGPPRSILGLCRGLLRAGVLVRVITTNAGGASRPALDVTEHAEYAGVPAQYLPLAPPRRLFAARGMRRALAAALPRHDLVHVHGIWHLPGWLAGRAARRARRPYVLSPRGMLAAGALRHHGARKRVAYRAFARGHVAGAALLHAGSEEEARRLAELGVPAPVVTVPNGVEVPVEMPPRGAVRRTLGLASDDPVVVFLGRIHPHKRLDLLAAAFAAVRAARPTARLVIAGPDEDGHRGALEPLFAGLGSSVSWLGEVGEADKWRLLADADALVLCSRSESFGLSVLEGMAAGVPVVVTRTCPWEDVEREGCGLWVDHDARAIADALVRVLGARDVRRAMGDRGRALARAKYSWDAVARTMADAYRAVLANRGHEGATP